MSSKKYSFLFRILSLVIAFIFFSTQIACASSFSIPTNETAAFQDLQRDITLKQKEILFSELTAYLDKAGLAGQIDANQLRDEIFNSQEYIAKQQRIATIKSNINSFLDNYASMTQQERITLANQLGITESELYSHTKEDIDLVKQYIQTQDAHFGDSAFSPLLDPYKKYIRNFMNREIGFLVATSQCPIRR